jgi:hypothetical protein
VDIPNENLASGAICENDPLVPVAFDSKYFVSDFELMIEIEVIFFG